ncbi:hypothetical protein AMTR_s00005p00266360 [Amborella trichopoda]|uniref:Uncharacterized protein n=1 Tax=Amborella trichopoda TaxID=13333 RepID=W1PH44_AMBTC|nr:hypothetical protein AMTR_s00005p00266360 [Amborella trichopoda]
MWAVGRFPPINLDGSFDGDELSHGRATVMNMGDLELEVHRVGSSTQVFDDSCHSLEEARMTTELAKNMERIWHFDLVSGSCGQAVSIFERKSKRWPTISRVNWFLRQHLRRGSSLVEELRRSVPALVKGNSSNPFLLIPWRSSLSTIRRRWMECLEATYDAVVEVIEKEDVVDPLSGLVERATTNPIFIILLYPDATVGEGDVVAIDVAEAVDEVSRDDEMWLTGFWVCEMLGQRQRKEEDRTFQVLGKAFGERAKPGDLRQPGVCKQF